MQLQSPILRHSPMETVLATFTGRMIGSKQGFMGSPSRGPKHHQLRLSNNYYQTICWGKRDSSGCVSYLAYEPFGHIVYAFLPL